MERIYRRVAGVDISRDVLDVHLRSADDDGSISRVHERFNTMTDGLMACGDWLRNHGVELVVMEATGVYWRAPYYALEPVIDNVWVLNAHHVKNVPGRKTDMADAEWLADVAAHGMVRPSFIPPAPIRELRELTRFRSCLVEERSRLVARLEKMLQDAGIKLTSVVSSVLSVSSRQMLELLVSGERDPQKLAACAKGRMRPKMVELGRALAGNFGEHHSVIVKSLLAQIDVIDAQVATITTEIEQRLVPHHQSTDRITTIPGIGPRVAQVVIAETGADMARFRTPGHLSAWAGLAPGNAESGGKRRRAGLRKAPPHLRSAMVQAAWTAVRVKDSYYAVMFRRLRARRGPQVAIIAVGRKLLEAVWHVLTNGVEFIDLGADYYDKRNNPQAQSRRLVRRLEALGHKVTLESIPEPA